MSRYFLVQGTHTDPLRSVVSKHDTVGDAYAAGDKLGGPYFVMDAETSAPPRDPSPQPATLREHLTEALGDVWLEMETKDEVADKLIPAIKTWLGKAESKGASLSPAASPSEVLERE